MANSATTKITRTAEKTSAILHAMAEDMRAEVLGAGMAALCRPIEIAAKRFAKRSERTGALRESITTKVVLYKKNGVAVGLVGPDRAYYIKGKKAGKLAALYGADRPANYAHLVEFGHVMVAPIKGTSRRKKTAVELRDLQGKTMFVPPKPFMRPAAITTSAQQSEAFFAAVDRGIERSFLRRNQ